MLWQTALTSLYKNKRKNHNKLHCLQEFASAITVSVAWTKMTAEAQEKGRKFFLVQKKILKSITAEEKEATKPLF